MWIKNITIMELNFNLDFLYYQKLIYLGNGKDEQLEAYREDIANFKTYLKTASLNNVINVIALAYKNKYAQEGYILRKLLVRGSSQIEVDYPEYVNEDSDLYLHPQHIDREDINYIYFKRLDDPENNTYYLEYLEMSVKTKLNLIVLKEQLEQVLDGKTYQVTNNEGVLSFTVEDSAIKSIEITENKFTMVTNPDKWERYLGV